MLAQRWETAPFRSEKLTRYAKGQSCVCCGACDGTVVLAHLPTMGISDGGSSKCDDFWGAHLCLRCHQLADGAEKRADIFWRAQMVARTLGRVFRNGKAKIT